MLVKGPRRLLLCILLLIALSFVLLRVFNAEWLPIPLPFRTESDWTKTAFTAEADDQNSQHETTTAAPGDAAGSLEPALKPDPFSQDQPIPLPGLPLVPSTHREIVSTSTATKTYFPLTLGSHAVINPNIIPHPTLNDTWIIVAQQKKSGNPNSGWHAELVCNAVFDLATSSLSCTEPPLLLPIASTIGKKCKGKLEYVNLNVGPHDARVFYGPDVPYTVYGSNSQFTCFGQWIQDFRLLVEWDYELSSPPQFRSGTELQRPESWGEVEKNFFLFWDNEGKAYVHYNVSPRRTFAKLESDGSVGSDLAPLAAIIDDKCMNAYMLKIADTEWESIHQATNSLSVTLCTRVDPLCFPNDDNTFIMTIFQHKSFYHYHGQYEPYVMLFKRAAPFEVYAISTKPIWINGRSHIELPDGKGVHSEQLYVTSMSWRNQGQKYHGYVDDVMFLAFGIEDSRTAGIDFTAGDLLQDLGLCVGL